MLIIPAEHPLDWKRPPVITLLLIPAGYRLLAARTRSPDAASEALRLALAGEAAAKEQNENIKIQ